jgi:hypothetical protein
MTALALAHSAALADSGDEAATAQRIAAQLEQSGQLKNYQLGVKYDEGTVWLLGSVTDASQEQTAIRLTQRMPGVRKVISNLELSDPPAQNQLNYAESLQLASMDMQQQQAQAAGQPNNGNLGGNPRLSTRNLQPRNAQAQRGRAPLTAQRIPAVPMQGGGPMARNAQPPMQYANHGGPRQANYAAMPAGAAGMAAVPTGYIPGGGPHVASYDESHMPGYAWPTYAAYPNYAALTYPTQYSPTAWPYIGPFYPYPQVPLGWRRVTLEWDDGWWFLDFNDTATH